MNEAVKKIILLLIITFGFSFSVNAQEAENKETGKIYLLRSTGLELWDGSFKTFIDGKLVCKLHNKKYSIHEVLVGKHECSVQFSGTKSKEKAEKFEVNVEKGKTTYVQLVFETGFFINKIYCEEVTENTAKMKMEKMKEDTECL